jgi:hypothetical protein
LQREHIGKRMRPGIISQRVPKIAKFEIEQPEL